MAAYLSTNARQHQLRSELRQALSSADAELLRRLSLQVIHRQGAEALQRLMQVLAEGEQLRFWLDVLQPAQAPVPQPLARVEPPAVPMALEQVEEPVAAEPEAFEVAAEVPVSEALELAAPEQAVEPVIAVAPVALEQVEEPVAAEPEAVEVAAEAPVSEALELAAPEQAVEPVIAVALEQVEEPAVAEVAAPEAEEVPVVSAEPEIAVTAEAFEPLAAEAPAVQPKPIREESIKFAAPPKRVVATPAPLERSRLHQRLKGWLPGPGRADQQAA